MVRSEDGTPQATDRPRIITVSGACAGVGKTRLVERLLRALPDAAAVKVVPEDSGDATIWEETSAGENPSKDTGRYLAAGASRAFLLSGARGELPAVARRLCEEAGTAVVVFETNSLAAELEPDLVLFVEGRGAPKPGAAACRRRADLIVHLLTGTDREDCADDR